MAPIGITSTPMALKPVSIADPPTMAEAALTARTTTIATGRARASAVGAAAPPAGEAVPTALPGIMSIEFAHPSESEWEVGLDTPPGQQCRSDEDHPAAAFQPEAGPVVDAVVGGLFGTREPAPAAGSLETKAVPHPTGGTGARSETLLQRGDAQTELHGFSWPLLRPDHCSNCLPVWRIRSSWETHCHQLSGMTDRPSRAPSTLPATKPAMRPRGRDSRVGWDVGSGRLMVETIGARDRQVLPDLWTNHVERYRRELKNCHICPTESGGYTFQLVLDLEPTCLPPKLVVVSGHSATHP